jgi:uncharacterized membrane protein (GlpM family)
MQFFIKLGLAVAVIVFCSQVGRRFPSLGGLIATMPLTSLVVLAWLYSDDPGNSQLMAQYVRGALWGIIPSMMFFVVLYLCFRKGLPLPLVLGAGFAVWLAGALVHQWLLK